MGIGVEYLGYSAASGTGGQRNSLRLSPTWSGWAGRAKCVNCNGFQESKVLRLDPSWPLSPRVSKLVGKAMDSDLCRCRVAWDTHSLPAYFHPSGFTLAIAFSEVSLKPSPQPSLSILYIPTMLCSHLSGLTILDTNYPSPHLDYKLLEGRAVFISFTFMYSQCLQCRRC